MSTLAHSWGEFRKPLQWMLMGGTATLILAAVALPNLQRSHSMADRSVAVAQQRGLASYVDQSPAADKAVSYETAAPLPVDAKKISALATSAAPDAVAGRKIVRTASVDMLVQHPAEMADSITKMAESLGGYLVRAEVSQNSAAATLTIRVPAARFDEARSQIRSLGLKVESEKVDAQDVTRQYVDEDANLRNLRAEEAQYLTILKQAHTVKDLLAVDEKLSEVRGEIEQQQAEFNTLAQQIETVAITISLRTQAEAQVFGLNWRPLYQLKLAVRDGLDSLATYATTMITILFNLPAVLLWIGTIGVASIGVWRTVRWIGRRWFGWNVNDIPVQQ
jgi:hypothetical protein